MNTSTNWFDDGGSKYALFRPTYPPALTKFLLDSCESHAKAVDIGCGNGQLTLQLSPHFKQVIGIDPSADQIANAPIAKNIQYLTAPAEKLPDECSGADLITAAQAAHWFQLKEFYSEVRKIANSQSIVALISYGVLDLPPELNQRFQYFYWNEIGSLWPAERKLVDNEYRDLEFPFKEFIAPQMFIELDWDLQQFLGYVSTWSAIKVMKQQNQLSTLSKFGQDLNHIWGKPTEKKRVAWPINMRIGKV